MLVILAISFDKVILNIGYKLSEDRNQIDRSLCLYWHIIHIGKNWDPDCLSNFPDITTPGDRVNILF